MISASFSPDHWQISQPGTQTNLHKYHLQSPTQFIPNPSRQPALVSSISILDPIEITLIQRNTAQNLAHMRLLDTLALTANLHEQTT